jgi:hypothetical protein
MSRHRAFAEIDDFPNRYASSLFTFRRTVPGFRQSLSTDLTGQPSQLRTKCSFYKECDAKRKKILASFLYDGPQQLRSYWADQERKNK